MTRRELAKMLGVLSLLPAGALLADPQHRGRERDEDGDPRIIQAIRQIEDVIDYLEHSRHDFDGSKADALRACKDAVHHLRRAARYRDRGDRR